MEAKIYGILDSNNCQIDTSKTMRGNNFNLFCFSLAELISQAKSIYNIDLLEILN